MAGRTIRSLNGCWKIQPGEEHSPPEEWTYVVQVPGLVDLATRKYDWKSQQYHWYLSKFDLASAERHDVVILRLDQAMYGTEVWLNGMRVGGDIACYTSQEYDISHLVKYGTVNILCVRVGARETLPPESAVGKDLESESFIPGIWGDAALVLTGNPRIKLVQILPDIETATAEVRLTIENCSRTRHHLRISGHVEEALSRNRVSDEITFEREIEPSQETLVSFPHIIRHLRLWSPDDPCLYQQVTRIYCRDSVTDEIETRFGMREFKVVGADFFLNGKRILLRGSNIAFHRFLSDSERGTLPWDPEWIKRALIDIPKEHNFNFFRNHLGQMYGKWYEIADEYGMLIQNEWQFWTTTGTKGQITKEFTRWLQDNWNHPSIIIWDPLNETEDDVVQKEIVPEMKKLDPTRPWESVDFVEQHPYIYSLGPVMNNRRLGFAQSLDDIEHSTVPSVVNEFLWWWLDRENEPTQLTRDVLERWMGQSYSHDELVAHQSFLAQELVELFRRMRVDAIQPFVYLSNSEGPTGTWFLGAMKELNPKPILKALKNAFAPFGVSLELWDRHFFPGERRTIRLFAFNDDTVPRKGLVRHGFVDEYDNWMSSTRERVHVEASGCTMLSIEPVFPAEPGSYFLKAELSDEAEREVHAYSRKIVHIIGESPVSKELASSRIIVLDGRGDVSRFMQKKSIPFERFDSTLLDNEQLLIVTEGMVHDERYAKRFDEISRFVRAGHTLLVIEPELGVEGSMSFDVVDGMKMEIARRADPDRGGYDSYVFAEDHHHPVWAGIEPRHLKMFNGSLGGEIVSQHNLSLSLPHTVLARCGLKLAVIAAAEAPYGEGTVVVSRLQTRGRLMYSESPDLLFARRADPVAIQFMLNILSYCIRKRI